MCGVDGLQADFFLAVALGVGGSEPPKDEPRKSLSNERTFAAISREADLLSKLGKPVHSTIYMLLWSAYIGVTEAARFESLCDLMHK